MRLPLARLLVKAAKWLAPRVQAEIEDEVLRKTGVDVRQQPGMGQGASIPVRRSTDSLPPPEGP